MQSDNFVETKGDPPFFQSKTPKITNFGLWDFKKFFVEHTVPSDVIFLNPHQAPEVPSI
jgi:hypothetical protein